MSKAHQPYSNRAEPARGSSLHTIKTQQKAKEEEERIRIRRRKAVVTLMLQFCQEMGYARTLDSLQADSGVILGKNAVPADNMDLTNIVTEYEDYYEFRFGKKPKLFRAPTEGDNGDGNTIGAFEAGEGMLPKPSYGNAGGPSSAPPAGRAPRTTAPSPPPPQQLAPVVNSSSVPSVPPSTAPAGIGKKGGKDPKSKGGDDEPKQLGVDGSAIKVTSAPGGGGIDNHFKAATGGANNDDDDENEDDIGIFNGGRALKPMPRFLTQELSELSGTIMRDILDSNPNVRFDHIAELTVAKDLLKESVVMPVKYPELFAGLVRPWKGILLFGPPGTGKTMLAKAVATECKTTFFNISASSIVSKWRGDSEKLVRMLFDLAVHYAPSTIFIDELDSIMSARSSDGSEHEGSRRMKTELLIQIDGLSKRKNGDVVFLLAASNVPWDLDAAILRRLEKRILVGLPSESARVDMFRHNLTANAGPANRRQQQSAASLSCPLRDEELAEAAKITHGYSGADIDIVCREATMRTIRQLISQLEAKGGPAPNTTVQRPSVGIADVMASIKVTNPSTHSGDLGKYEQWAKAFGSTMS